MTRLTKKNLLHVEKHELAYAYVPAVTEQEFISTFVRRILEDLFVSFSGVTLKGLDALPNQEAAAHAREYLAEIMRRQQEES